MFAGLGRLVKSERQGKFTNGFLLFIGKRHRNGVISAIKVGREFQGGMSYL
jgi:hypothetical protein